MAEAGSVTEEERRGLQRNDENIGEAEARSRISQHKKAALRDPTIILWHSSNAQHMAT